MSQALGAKANQYIADAMQCLGSVPESYTHALCDAAMAIADHLVQDKKVLIVGLDDCGGLTDYCVNAFTHRNASNRPALPCIGFRLQSSSHDTLDAEIRHLKSITQNDDLLLILCDGTNLQHSQAQLEACCALSTSSIVIAPSHVLAEPTKGPHLITFNERNTLSIHEMILFSVNRLLALTEQQLFGDI